MNRLSKAVSDVRALGTSAVPRAFYESSKKVGGHALLFRPRSGESAVRPILPVPEVKPNRFTAQATYADAVRICDQGLLSFGSSFKVSDADDWVADPVTGQRWASDKWWKIDIRSANRVADVKWTWELGRHRDLVVLARAYWLDPDNDDWLAELARLLRLWLVANPPEASIHWYSNLEIALRLIAWDQILGLTGAALPQDVLGSMAIHVGQAKRHLLRDLPYTVSSMKNNHLLGDALGIQLASQMTGHGESSRSARIADRLWRKQLGRHMNDDGSMVEDSLSYHRFVLEMLCVRKLLGDSSESLRGSLRAAANYLVELGVMDVQVPQFGDWDEGRVLTTSTDPLDVANSAALALSLAGENIPSEWYEKYDLLSWYAPSRTACNPTDAVAPHLAGPKRVGGFAHSRAGSWQVWLKAGIGPSHGHADLGHVSAMSDGRWVLTDPGTGTYNGPLHIRNGFRTSQGHNVLRIDNEDQLGPHRAFRWQRSPWARCGEPTMRAESQILWGANNAYSFLPGVGRSARVVVVRPDGVVVVDWTETSGAYEFGLSVPFGTDVDISRDSFRISSGGFRVATGEDQPWLGWQSETYGCWEPAPWVTAKGTAAGPLWWSVGTSVAVSETDQTVTVADVSLTVEWRDQSTLLRIAGDGSETVAVIAGSTR